MDETGGENDAGREGLSGNEVVAFSTEEPLTLASEGDGDAGDASEEDRSDCDSLQ